MASSTMSRLMSLPLELREKIWKCALADTPKDFVLERGMKPSRFFYPNSLPPLAFVHPQLFEEIFLVWIQSRHFVFESGPTMPEWFVWWMDKIAGGRAWANVKSLSFTEELKFYRPFPLPGRPAYWNAADLVTRAVTLQRLTITISSLTLIHFNAQTGYFTHIKPMEEVLATLDLRNILHCGPLQDLTVVCCPTWKGKRCIEAADLGCKPEDLFLPLCTWFQQEFLGKSRKVKIRAKLDRRGMKFSGEPRWEWPA